MLTLPQLLGPRRVLIPKMPALGLLLEQPLFDNYNRKVASAGVAPDSTDYRAPLDFAPHVAEIAAFKSEHIYARMRALEGETGLFDAWARHLDKYAGDDLNWVRARSCSFRAA
jgi:tRNA pseudouridine38-40 synthase